MVRTFAALASAALLCGCLSISQTSAASGAAEPVGLQGGLPYASGTSRVAAEQPAGTYALDGRHASVIWRIRHAGVGVFSARFDTISGQLQFDPAAPEKSQVTAKIAAASVNTGVLNDAGERAFDKEIHQSVFGSASNPDITFVSRSIRLTGPTTGEITGDLTLRGVTKPVTLNASFEGGRYIQVFGKHDLGFTAHTVINRKDFGAAFPNPLADAFVGDQVEILIAAEFDK